MRTLRGAGALLLAALIALSTRARATELEGSDALALAARVGAESPKLTRNEKLELASFLEQQRGRTVGGHQRSRFQSRRRQSAVPREQR